MSGQIGSGGEGQDSSRNYLVASSNKKYSSRWSIRIVTLNRFKLVKFVAGNKAFRTRSW